MSAIRPVSNDNEARLAKVVQQTIELTNAGTDPTEALAKVAAAHDLGSEFIKRAAELYNASRTIAHIKANTGEDRAESFPLAVADTAKARCAILHKKEAAIDPGEGVFGDYMALPEAPTVEKAAAAPSANVQYLRLRRTGSEPRRALAEAAVAKTASELTRQHALAAAADALRRAGAIEKVAEAMHHTYGETGRLILAVAAEEACRSLPTREKVASSAFTLADPAVAPYAELFALLEASENYAQKRAEYLACEAELAAHERTYADFRKSAFLDAAAPMTYAASAIPGLIAAPKPADPNKELEKLLDLASDPMHEAEVDALDTEVALNELMASDPVIGQYDDDDVIQAYNELSRLAPRAVRQPSVLRATLRKYLESGPTADARNMEMYEADQLLGMEQRMRPATTQSQKALTQPQGSRS